MITNFLILLASAFGLILIAIIPDAQFDSTGLDEALEYVIPIVSKWNNLLPIDTLLTIFGLVMAIEAGFLVFRIISWIRPPFTPLHPNF